MLMNDNGADLGRRRQQLPHWTVSPLVVMSIIYLITVGYRSICRSSLFSEQLLGVTNVFVAYTLEYSCWLVWMIPVFAFFFAAVTLLRSPNRVVCGPLGVELDYGLLGKRMIEWRMIESCRISRAADSSGTALLSALIVKSGRKHVLFEPLSAEGTRQFLEGIKNNNVRLDETVGKEYLRRCTVIVVGAAILYVAAILLARVLMLNLYIC